MQIFCVAIMCGLWGDDVWRLGVRVFMCVDNCGNCVCKLCVDNCVNEYSSRCLTCIYTHNTYIHICYMCVRVCFVFLLMGYVGAHKLHLNLNVRYSCTMCSVLKLALEDCTAIAHKSGGPITDPSGKRIELVVNDGVSVVALNVPRPGARNVFCRENEHLQGSHWGMACEMLPLRFPIAN